MRSDPTNTTSIVKAFQRDIIARLKWLTKQATQLIVKDDALGLAGGVVTNAPRVWQYYTDPEKVKEFDLWLGSQIDMGVLSVDTFKYVDKAYRKGMIQSYINATPKKNKGKTPDWLHGSKMEFLEAASRDPKIVGKVKMLASRAYDELVGVTSEMATKMRRVLTNGLIHGKTPTQIGDALAKSVRGLPRKRAQVIARTEVVAAHAEGSLDAYEALGVSDVGVLAEWTTAGDDRVCPQCSAMEGAIFTIDQARGLIPLHANCVSGDMVIQCTDPLAVIKSTFTGRVIEIVTSKGRRITITPKHILLTQRGWVPAELLTESDQLLDEATFDRTRSRVTPLVPLTRPHDYKNVTPIEDVFNTLVVLRGVGCSVSPTTPEDFYGDGGSLDKEVHILNLDGVLGYSVKSQLFGIPQELPFILRSLFASHLSSMGGLEEALKTLVCASDSIMRRPSVPPMFLLRSCGHHKTISVNRGSFRNPTQIQSVVDSSPTYTQGDSNRVNTLPVYETLDDVLGREDIGNTPPSSIVCYWDPIVSLNSHLVRSLPMYDVSTGTTTYLLNGVVSSNCRCAWVPSTKVKQTSRLRASLARKLTRALKRVGKRSTWSGKQLLRRLARKKARKRGGK